MRTGEGGSQLMALTIGSRIAHYDVTALIGEGGMGRVYQATDTKLYHQHASRWMVGSQTARGCRSALRWLAVLSLLIAIPSDGIAQSAEEAPARTVWGDPDLQGTWDNRTITPLERPSQFADAETLTAAEAARYEASTAERRVDDRYYWDRGTRVVEDRRTSLIIDPPDGRVPPLTRAGQHEVRGRSHAGHGRS